MFALTFAVLLSGFPVAFCLSGTAILFAAGGILTGDFDAAFLAALPERIFGIMINETLIAVPLFVFMGVALERSKIAEDLLETMAMVFGGLRGGLGISVCLVGGLLAASTGIVGATVVTMGLISLPAMMKRSYSPSLSTGIICASGTLGQIIPPSIILVILGEVISSANQQAQLEMGNYSPTSVSVGDLFMGALIPGIILMGLYILYIIAAGLIRPTLAPATPPAERPRLISAEFSRRLAIVLAPPLVLIIGVLGSILMGVATPTEAASVGAVGALILSLAKGQLTTRFSQRDLTDNDGSKRHGLHHPDRSQRLLAGLSRLWRRLGCGGIPADHGRRRRHIFPHRHGGHVPARIFSRLLRDHLRRRSHRRSHPDKDGPGSGCGWE